MDWGSPLTGENERSHQYSRGSGGVSDGERLLVTSPSLERGLDLNSPNASRRESVGENTSTSYVCQVCRDYSPSFLHSRRSLWVTFHKVKACHLKTFFVDCILEPGVLVRGGETWFYFLGIII